MAELKIRIDAGLKKKIRILAAENGVSMNAFIVQTLVARAEFIVQPQQTAR